MRHKSPSDWVSGFQTGFWRFPRLRNRRKLNCKITDVLETEEGLVEQVKVQKVSRPRFLIAKSEVDVFGWVKQSS